MQKTSTPVLTPANSGIIAHVSGPSKSGLEQLRFGTELATVNLIESKSTKLATHTEINPPQEMLQVLNMLDGMALSQVERVLSRRGIIEFLQSYNAEYGSYPDVTHLSISDRMFLHGKSISELPYEIIRILKVGQNPRVIYGHPVSLGKEKELFIHVKQGNNPI